MKSSIYRHSVATQAVLCKTNSSSKHLSDLSSIKARCFAVQNEQMGQYEMRAWIFFFGLFLSLPQSHSKYCFHQWQDWERMGRHSVLDVVGHH